MIRSLLLLILFAGCFRSPPSAEPTPRPVPTDPAMVLVKGGVFTQGSAGATGDDLGWPHQEVVPSFYADVTEVTVQAYQTCLQAGACSYPPLPEPNEEIAYRTSRKIATGAALRSPRCNLEREKAEYANDPVNCVTWQEAATFCAWRGAELPTEAMWEYAAGGARGWAWPWNPADWERADHTRHLFLAQHGNCREAGSLDSSKLPRRAAYYRDTSCPVGSTPRGDSPDGIKDMEGNVSEWTRSNYCRRPGIDCKADARVVKGTSYEYLGGPWVGIQQRLSRPVAHWSSQIGFRCARLAGAGGAKGERSR